MEVVLSCNGGAGWGFRRIRRMLISPGHMMGVDSIEQGRTCGNISYDMCEWKQELVMTSHSC